MHLGMTHTEIYKLPVAIRHWYLARLTKHFKDQTAEYKKQSGQQQVTGGEDRSVKKFFDTVNTRIYSNKT